MIVETRKTAADTEYWDNKEKRVLFVPTGEDLQFEVTENPKSMLDTEPVQEQKVEVNLEAMTVKQLRKYANDNQIEIPADITKKEEIILFLSNEE